MQAIERCPSEVSVGAVQRHRNLAVFPLISGGVAAPWYSMLDEALGSGRALVTEVTESGSVSELAFENAGADPVLLVDGEELRGARQNRIWEEIDERFAAADQVSETAAMSDLYESERARLDAYERAFDWQPGQAGAVFAIDGQPVAVELFDSPDTFRKFMKKAVGSFAMDAVAARLPVDKAPTKKKVEAFLAGVQAAAVECFAAAGEGEDLRVSGSGLAGGALEAQGRVVHLSVFRVDA